MSTLPMRELADDDPVPLRDAVDEVAAALAGHMRGALNGDQQQKYVHAQMAVDEELRGATTAAQLFDMFRRSRHPGSYRYRDVYPYHIAVYRLECIRVALERLLERAAAEQKWQEWRERPLIPRSFVYFIEAGGFIKIGFTTDLASRLLSLDTASPHRLNVIRQEPGTLTDEAAYHERFADLWVKGEWFRFEGALRDYLEGSAP